MGKIFSSKYGRQLALVIMALCLAIPYSVASQSGSSMKCYDSISGLSTFYEIKTEEKNDYGILTLTKPDESKAIFMVETDSFGSYYGDINEFHISQTGNYVLSYKNTSYTEYLNCGFKVYSGSPDQKETKIDIIGSGIAIADSQDSIELKIQLKDDNGNPVSNYKVNLIPAKSEVKVKLDSFASDKNGEIKANISSSKAGKSEISIYDPSTNEIYDERIEIMFVEDPQSSLLELGGEFGYASFFDMARAAQDYGPIDGFKIDMGSNQVVAGQAINVEVTAIDSDENTVLNYLGEIIASTTDDLATIPGTYEFKESDAGSHTFNLSFVFSTLGKQTLSINDTEDFALSSSIEFEVVSKTSSSSSTSPNNTEVSQSTEMRLTSPSSGTYPGNLNFSGNTSPNTSVQIYINSNLVEQVISDNNGNFNKTISNLEDGLYTVFAIATNKQGTTLAKSEEVSLKIDASAAQIESITIDPETIQTGKDFFITVFSEPYLAQASVIINDKIVDLSEDADHTGEYSAKVKAPSNAGEYQIEVILVDQLGQEGIYPSSAKLTVKAKEENTVIEEPIIEEDNSEFIEEPVEELLVYPSQVSGFEVSEISSNRVDLEWEAADSGSEENFIKNYRIYYGTSPDNLNFIVNTFDSSTRWYIANLQNNSNYYFQITALNSDNLESQSTSTMLSAIPQASEEIHNSALEEDPPQEEPIIFEEKIEETADSGPGIIVLLLTTLILTDIYIRARKEFAKLN